MLIDSFKMIGIIVSIFIFSYMFGIITLAIIPFIVLFTMWIRKRMYKAQLSNRKLEGSVNNLVLENIDNIVTIKTFRIYDKVNAKYDEVLKNHFKTNQKANTYDALFFLSSSSNLKNSLILWIAASDFWIVCNSIPRFSIGDNRLVIKSIELTSIPTLIPNKFIFAVERVIIKTIKIVFIICITGENKAS